MTSRSTPTSGGEHPTGNTSDGNTVLDTASGDQCESATHLYIWDHPCESASTRFTSADLPLLKVPLFFHTLAIVLPTWLGVVMLTWRSWLGVAHMRRYDRSEHSVEVMIPQSPRPTVSLPDNYLEGDPFSPGYTRTSKWNSACQAQDAPL